MGTDPNTTNTYTREGFFRQENDIGILGSVPIYTLLLHIASAYIANV